MKSFAKAYGFKGLSKTDKKRLNEFLPGDVVTDAYGKTYILTESLVGYAPAPANVQGAGTLVENMLGPITITVRNGDPTFVKVVK